MENTVKDEIIECYKKVCLNTIDGIGPYHIYPDFKSFYQLFKGIDCTECHIGEYLDYRYYDGVIYGPKQKIEGDSKVVYIDNQNCKIWDKNTSLDVVMKILPAKFDNLISSVRIKQYTEEGVYNMVIDATVANYPPRVFIQFSPVEYLKYWANRNNYSLEEHEYAFVHENRNHEIGLSGIESYHIDVMFNLDRSDIAIMANKTYKSGLKPVFEAAKKASLYMQYNRMNPYGYREFELTDDEKNMLVVTDKDREDYKLNSADLASIKETALLINQSEEEKFKDKTFEDLLNYKYEKTSDKYMSPDSLQGKHL